MPIFGRLTQDEIAAKPTASALYKRKLRERKRPEVEARWQAKRAAVDYDALRVTFVSIGVSRPERERVHALAAAQGLSVAEACRHVIFAAMEGSHD